MTTQGRPAPTRTTGEEGRIVKLGVQAGGGQEVIESKEQKTKGGGTKTSPSVKSKSQIPRRNKKAAWTLNGLWLGGGVGNWEGLSGRGKVCGMSWGGKPKKPHQWDSRSPGKENESIIAFLLRKN